MIFYCQLESGVKFTRCTVNDTPEAFFGRGAAGGIFGTAELREKILVQLEGKY